MKKLQSERNTYLKQEPIQSKYLGADDLFRIKKGDILEYESRIDIGTHSRLVLANPLGGNKIWYAFDDHIHYDYIEGNGVGLGRMPYLSQMDNTLHPRGTCNVTSAAMCLKYFGKNEKTSPDELLRFMWSKGWDRHVHAHLSKLIQNFGVANRFSTVTSFENMIDHLRAKKPVIYSGRFTRSGHIIVFCGFNKNGFEVKDPYGEYFSRGYKVNRPGGQKFGDNLTYSYNLIKKVSYSGSKHGWAHLVG